MPKIQLSLAIAWVVFSCTQVESQPGAQILGQNPTLKPREQSNSLVFAAPPPPPDIGEPGQRSEAGSRGCENTNTQLASSQQQLIALAPVYPKSELVLGTTIASAPTFWFYLPYQPPFLGEFVLRDKNGTLIYQTDVTLPDSPGVVSLSLPQTVAPLEIGKQYRWFLKVYCKAQEPPTFVEGWIQRIALNPVLKSQVEKATPRERVALYAANGIWFEALNTAGELHRRNPNDSSWAALLQSIGLNGLANEPIVDCCTPR